MLGIWKLIDNQIVGIGQTERLGYPQDDFSLPEEYIQAIPAIPIFRTCHGFGDWGILSAMPRLIKEKYPDKEVLIPSPELIHQMFSHFIDNLKWWSSWKEPWMNARNVFANNPYVDGEFSSFQGEIFCDHLRLYSTDTIYDPLAKQMLRVWSFTEEELSDVRPELYFSKEEIEEGDKLIAKHLGEEFTSLILSNKHIYGERDNQVIEVLKQYPYKCLYYSSVPLEETPYRDYVKEPVKLLDVTKDLRLQLYIRSKAQANIGTQSGVMDIIARYTPTYILPHNTEATFKSGNFIQTVNYIV